MSDSENVTVVEKEEKEEVKVEEEVEKIEKKVEEEDEEKAEEESAEKEEKSEEEKDEKEEKSDEEKEEKDEKSDDDGEEEKSDGEKEDKDEKSGDEKSGDDDEEKSGDSDAEEKPKKKKKKVKGSDDEGDSEEDDDEEEEEEKEKGPPKRKPPARAPPPTPPKVYEVPKSVWKAQVVSTRVWEVDEEQEYAEETQVAAAIDLSATPASAYKAGVTLGQGYFGTVVKATKDSKTFAVKIINKELAPQWAEKTELDILKRLDHKNVAKGVEDFATEEQAFVVLEYAGGDYLQVATDSKADYTEATVHQSASQLLAALEHLHSHNIVHGDLAPENLLRKEKSESSDLIVAGFSNSRRVAGDNTTVHEQLIGNPAFQGPEVLMNQGFGKSSDVWAAGCLLYFFAVGKSPFDDANTMRMNMKIRQAKFQFEDDEWKGVSDSLKDLIKKMLLTKPEERISAKEAASHPWVTGSPGSAALPKFRANVAAFGVQ